MEVFDSERALRTMATQIGALYASLPSLLEAVAILTQQQVEHERRIIRLEGLAESQKEHERRIIRLEGLIESLCAPGRP